VNNSLDEKKRKLAELLSSKAWRMSNLYFCKDENGKEFKFIDLREIVTRLPLRYNRPFGVSY